MKLTREYFETTENPKLAGTAFFGYCEAAKNGTRRRRLLSEVQ